MTYQDYLNSPDWHQKRRQKLGRKGGTRRRCAICGSTQRLDVHHLIYRRDLTKTLQSDLRVLCRRCHDVTHTLIRSDVLRLTTENTTARFAKTQAAVSEALGLPPSLPIRRASRQAKPCKRRNGHRPGWNAEDDKLLDRLRVVRLAVARDACVAPFVIFTDAVLRVIARSRPTCMTDLLYLKGIGTRKANDYGERFLAVIGTRGV